MMPNRQLVTALLLFAAGLGSNARAESAKAWCEPVKVGVFRQEVATAYDAKSGLPEGRIHDIAYGADGAVYAATQKGLARCAEGQWQVVQAVPAVAIGSLATRDDIVLVAAGTELFRLRGNQADKLTQALPAGVTSIAADADGVWIGAASGLHRFSAGKVEPVTALAGLLGKNAAIRQVAVASDGRIAVAAQAGVFLRNGEAWARLLPTTDRYSWAGHDARGVAFDAKGRLWFCCPQGVGCRRGDTWRLFTGLEGLPYNDFTAAAAGKDTVWFGTKLGAIRLDGDEWGYRQGRRWLPHDEVAAIAVDTNGDAWFATAGGVGRIEHRPMTLADKARYFEDVIDKRHRRTKHGYVLHCRLAAPGDIESPVQNYDSDNDGLWTGMYGAGECFAYAATKDPNAKRRAKAAFEALKFLCDVTQGGEKEVQRGFPARTVLPTSGHNPNETYTLERDRQRRREGDPFWKLIHPRWPKSADGKWYWKCDTSSDELDGHYFLNARYYDLVAETPEEKARVRKVICDTTDHLMENDYSLIDWDGRRTRWAYFGPQDLNRNPACWEERGMNSLGILSYLAVAHHVSGDPKYRRAKRELINKHHYAMNAFQSVKVHLGPGTGNQSDDEMTIMRFYNLIKYETDPIVREMMRWAFWKYWRLVRRERNPFFHFLYADTYRPSTGVLERFSFKPTGDWLADSVDMLKGQPLCLVQWPLRNSHRIDILPHFEHGFRKDGRPTHGFGRDGKVIPIENRNIHHWSADVWRLDQGGNGLTESDGAFWLMGYYAGKCFGFIED